MKPSEFSDNSARWSECSFCGKTQLDSFSHFHSLWACDGKTGTEAPIHHSIALCVTRCCTCDKHGQRGPQSQRQQRCGVLVTRATSDFMVHHRDSAATHASRLLFTLSTDLRVQAYKVWTASLLSTWTRADVRRQRAYSRVIMWTVFNDNARRSASAGQLTDS